MFKLIAFAALLVGCSHAPAAVDMGVDASVDMADMAPDAACSVTHCTKDSDCCPGDVCDQVATPGICQGRQ